MSTKAEQNQQSDICWEIFKEEKCDINEPTSKCKKLLECSSAETKSDWNFGYWSFFEGSVMAIIIILFLNWRRIVR
jgi:hypothetical protein